MDCTYSFGYWLRRRRKALDLTQAELAQQVGCAVDTIRKIETGARRPSRPMAERIAAALALTGADRAAFIKVARAELAAFHLPVPSEPLPAGKKHLAEDSPPPHSTIWRKNLPPQPTPFIGRKAELAALADLIAMPAVRLITIVGLGGIGKTRLALEVAAQQRVAHDGAMPRFPDGVIFVSLAGLESSTQIEAAMLGAIGLAHDRSARTARQQVIGFLRRKRLLLVLDNYEHLLDGVDLVADIVQSAPAVTVIVTARERLQLREEYLFMLKGLAVPEHTMTAEAVSYDAVQLFLQAARHIQPAFAPTQADMHSIVAICQLVEGMPLALELAAAWIGVLSPAAILAALQRSSDLLTTTLHDVPARQRSLRAVFDATWQELSAADQRAFARLAVFRGSFTHEAAHIVAATDMVQLAHLVSKAVLRYCHALERYSIHELLRQYGAEHLAGDPADAAQTRERHAAYYCDLVARLGVNFHGPNQQAALTAIGNESENVRAAWHYAAARGRLDLLALAADSLGYFYEWHAYLQDGQDAYRAAASAVEQIEDGAEHIRLLARLHAWQGVFNRLAGQYDAAEQHLQRSLVLLEDACRRDAETRSARAFALWRLGQLVAHDAPEAALRPYERSLQLYRELNRDWEASAVLTDLGDIARACGRFAEAEQYLGESLRLYATAGDRHGEAVALQQLSQVCIECGRFEQAEALARHSNEACQMIGNRSMRAASLGQLGIALLWRGRNAAASELLAQSLALFQDLGHTTMLALAHARVALVLAHLGRFAEAIDHAEEAAEIEREHDGLNLAIALWCLGIARQGLRALSQAEAALTESIALCRAHGLHGRLGWSLAALACVVWEQGDRRRARQLAGEALQLVVEQRELVPLIELLPILPLLLADQGAPVRAVELYTLARRHPVTANSALGFQRYAAQYAAIAAALPPAVVAAAEERGSGLDLWDTAAAVLDHC